MSKKEEFKEFVKERPQLVKYIKNGEMSWQKFYEIYDLYGDSKDAWDKYLLNDDRAGGITEGLGKFTEIVKNVDMESIKSHINTAQKALDFVQDLTVKKGTDLSNFANNLNKGPVSPRPINKFFED